MIKYALVIIFFISSSISLHAQIGGNNSYEFLNIPYTARLSGLGGVNVSQVDQDVNLFLSNPALSGDTLSGYASANFLSYFANINLASFSYARKVDQLGGMFSVGVQHIGLGNMEGFDATGVATNSFQSGETAVTLGHSRTSGNFRMGLNMKLVSSNIAGFRSSAILFDLGGAFVHPDKQLNIGLAIKNIGFVLSDYTDNSETKLPLDVQLGASFKPEHMPFRFSITAYQFANNGDDIAFYEPTSRLQEEKPGVFDQFARHFVIGTEFLLSKNVNFRLGYNHLVRKELRLESKAGGAGFSYGFMFRVKAMELAYSKGGYHVAGGGHHFTLTINTNAIIRR